MLTKTSEIAIQALVYLAKQSRLAPTAPAVIAAKLNASPTYMAKITSMLVKAGILTAHRGVRGGVVLNRSPEHVTLLEVIGACQSNLIDSCCQESAPDEVQCTYHRAVRDLATAVRNTLSRWTVADLMSPPLAPASLDDGTGCKMSFLVKRSSEG